MKLNFADKVANLPEGAKLLRVDKFRIEFLLNGKNIVYFFNEEGSHILTMSDSSIDKDFLKKDS